MNRWSVLAKAFPVLALVLMALLTACAGGAASPTPSPTPGDGNDQNGSGFLSEGELRQIAEDFMRNGPTFRFDGMEPLELADTTQIQYFAYPNDGGWVFTFRFQSRQAGYGDRTGQMLAQVITPHEARATVLGKGTVTEAVLDGVWDELNQRMLNASQ